MVSLYFHVPFCNKKCPYCHFYVIPNQAPQVALYMSALEREWLQKRPLLQNKEPVSIYFGGGTPALLPPSELKRILTRVPHQESCEITLEANPENLTQELLAEFREAGVNRLSIGVQSFSDKLLKRLRRTHSAQDAIRAVENAHAAGFSNISIDLMYDLPTQGLSEWEETVIQAAKLPISHLSLYNLTIEPHTLFFKQRKTLEPLTPSRDESLAMYDLAVDIFKRSGLEQYEISAFARDKKHSIHNSGYWTGRSFLGLGPSAFSYWENERFQNISNLHKYSKSLEEDKDPADFREKLSDEARSRESLVLQLRLHKGVQLEEAPSMELNILIESGLIAHHENQIRLTPRGIRLYDTVASELI